MMNILVGCLVYGIILVFVLLIFLAVFEVICFGQRKSKGIQAIIWGGATLAVIGAYQFNKVAHYGGTSILAVWYTIILLTPLLLAILGLFHFVKDFRTIHKKTILTVFCLALVVTGGIMSWLIYVAIPYIRSIIPPAPAVPL